MVSLSRAQRLLLLAGCGLAAVLGGVTPAATAGEAAAETPAAAAAEAVRAADPERRLARTLARLDEVLGLGTFPDASPLWPARLAAALEHRAEQDPSSQLLRRLASELRRLPLDRPLGPPSAASPGPAAVASSPRRSELVGRILDSAEPLLAKHERKTGSPAAARELAGLAVSGNDVCASAAVVGLGTFTGTTAGAGSDGDASCGSSGASPDVWFRFTAPASGSYRFDTAGSSFDTVLSIYDGCDAGGGGNQELGCSDDVAGGVTSRLTLAMAGGGEVWIRLSGFSGAAGPYQLEIEESRGIRGTITRQDGGLPLSGVEVTIYNDNGWYLDTATSGAFGFWQSGQLDPGTYYAWARADGYVPELYDDLACPSQSYCYPTDGSPITVGSGYAEGVDFALLGAASLSGSLTESGTGDPLDGFVYLYDATGAFVTSEFGSGSYSFTELPAGKYYLLAEAYDHRAELYDDIPWGGPGSPVTAGTQIVAAAGATLSGLDFVLDPYPAISGELTEDGSGTAIAGERVELYRDTGSWFDSRWTESDGSYRFDSLPPGTYYVRTDSDQHFDELYDDLPCSPSCTVTTGSPVTTAIGADTTGIDFALVPYGRIAGTVIEEGTGTALDGVYLQVFDDTGDYWGNAISRSDGTYTTRGMPAGTYHVYTSSDVHEDEIFDDVVCGTRCDPSRGDPVTVSIATVTSGVDFALRRAGSISGMVVEGPGGTPLAGAYVRLYDATGSDSGIVVTNGTGRYELAGVRKGTYFVRTDVYGYSDELYDGLPCEPSCTVTSGTPVSVQTETTTSGIDFSLDRLGSIEGEVTLANPAAGVLDAEIHLYTEDGSLRASEWLYGSGDFRFEALAPGSYRLRVLGYPWGSPQVQDELFDDVPCEPDCDLSLGTPLTVALNGGIVGIEIVLALCPHDSYQRLVNLQILSAGYTAEACEEVTAQNVTVTSGSTATFRAGRRVVLGDGFKVGAGASFTAGVEPGWTED